MNITSLMADYGLNLMFVEACLVEFPEEFKKGDVLVGVKNLSFSHQNGPGPSSICCHGVVPPFVSGVLDAGL